MEFKQSGDYQYPDLKVEGEELEIGKFGQLRGEFLQEERYVEYMKLFKTGELLQHLYEVDQAAEAAFSRTLREMAKAEGVEELRNTNPLKFARIMNNLDQAAKEIVLRDYVYV